MMNLFTALEDDFKLGTFWLSLECFLVWFAWRAACVMKWAHRNWNRWQEALGRGIGVAWTWLINQAYNWYHHRFAQIDVRRKCPACGVRIEHQIMFSMDYSMGGQPGTILHDCPRCKATSGESPIVAAKQWHVELPKEKK
jgi:hypothetical protein